MATQQHDRYRIEIYKGDELITKLAVPKSRTRFHTMEIARKEVARVPTATHARVRSLTGHEVEVYQGDSWLSTQITALKMR
ncbi:hypothetical protein [Aliidiomarina indica]|uniref:hypothetical protein n=1 Tax=Aliidiomarina indica TaxID=2749147 RepID=UPI00188FDC4E|nr:hypothetical protein [Aliidiomarina indica]